MAQRGKRGPSRPPAAPPAFVLWALPPEAGLWPGPPHPAPARESRHQEGEAPGQKGGAGSSLRVVGWGDSLPCLLTPPWTGAVLVTWTAPAHCSPARLPQPRVRRRGLTEAALPTGPSTETLWGCDCGT